MSTLLGLFLVTGFELWTTVAGVYEGRLLGKGQADYYGDYLVFYAAGRLVAHGRGAEIYDLRAVEREETAAAGHPLGLGRLPFVNPPFVALAFASLALLPPQMAAAVWGLVNLALLALASFALLRLAGLRQKGAVFFGLTWLFTFAPVVAVILQGQLTVFLLLGWLGFVSMQMSGRQKASGLSLALFLIKPQMALLPLIVLLWKRRWEALGAFAGAALLLMALSIATAGPLSLISYPRALLSDHTAELGADVHWMYGWNGFFSLILGPGYIETAIVAAASAGTVLMVSIAWRGPLSPASAQFLSALGALIVGSLLANPHVQIHDLTLLSVALACGVRASSLRSAGLDAWAVIAAVLWLGVVAGAHLRVELGVNLVTPGLGLLLFVFLRQMGRGEAIEADLPAQATAA